MASSGYTWLEEYINGLIPVGAKTMIVHPVADAYVRGGTYATQNLGAEGTVDVKDDADPSLDRNSYLNFNVGALGIASASRATLRLYTVFHNTDAAVRVRTSTSTTWTEGTGTAGAPTTSGITWNNQPGGTGTGVAQTVAADNTWTSIDVTSLVQTALANDGVISLVVDPAPGVSGRRAKFHSRHNTNIPVLEFTVP